MKINRIIAHILMPLAAFVLFFAVTTTTYAMQIFIKTPEGKTVTPEVTTYDEDDVARLQAFFIQDTNDAKLGLTDLDNPADYPGVEWIEDDGVYYIKRLDFTDSGLSGSFDMSNCTHLQSVNLSLNQYYPGDITPLANTAFIMNKQEVLLETIPVIGNLDVFALDQASYRFISSDGVELSGVIGSDLSYDLSAYQQEEVYLEVTKKNFSYSTNLVVVDIVIPPVKEMPPSAEAAMFDYEAETILFDSSLYEASYMNDFSDEMVKRGDQIEADEVIYLRTKAGADTEASDPVAITIPDRIKTPANPVITAVLPDRIEIAAVPDVVYVLGDIHKRTTVVYTGLEADTEYVVSAYIPSDGVHFKSLTSSTTVTTEKAAESQSADTAAVVKNEVVNQTESTSQTGDTALLLVMVIVFIISAVIVIGIFRKRNHSHINVTKK